MGEAPPTTVESDEDTAKIRELLRNAESHILKLKMVALEDTEIFDDRAALSSVFHESFHAKNATKNIQQIIQDTRRTPDHSLQEPAVAVRKQRHSILMRPPASALWPIPELPG